MEGTPTPRGSNDQPAMIWPLGAEEREEVLAEACRWGVVSGRELHLLRKGAIEEVERRLIMVVAHVVDVCGQRPVNGLGAKGGLAALGEEIFRSPLLVDRPSLHRRCEDEWFVQPCLYKLVGGDIREA